MCYVQNIPAKHLKLPTLQQHGMEEHKPTQQLAVLVSRMTHLKLLLRQRRVQALLVGPQTLRRLGSHFDSGLRVGRTRASEERSHMRRLEQADTHRRA